MKVFLPLLTVALAIVVDASPVLHAANAVEPSLLPQTAVLQVTAGEADAATPQIEDSALALLEKSQTTMHNLKTYYAESWTVYTYPLDPDDQPQPNRNSLEILTAEKPNRLRDEIWEMTSLDNGTWVKKTVDPAVAMVCDGKTLWEQHGKQYHAEPFTDIDPLVSLLQYGFFEDKFSPYLMAKSSGAAGILQKLWRQGSDTVEGKPCEKVSRRIESVLSAHEKETIETTWYIDADGLIRRRVETVTLPKRLGLSYTSDSTLRVLRVNATIANPEKRFAYTPPKDVKYSEKITLNLPKPIAAGDSAPDFAAIRPDGTAIKLSDFRGKVVLLCFCASWSVPCNAALPHFQEVAQTLQASNIPVVVLAVDNSEEQAPFLAWVKAHPELSGITFAYEDPKIRSINALDYKVFNIPTMYAIDRQGIVRGHSTSYTTSHDGVEAVLRAAAVPLEK